jgi:hypothetical protein
MILTMPFAKNRKMEFFPDQGVAQELHGDSSVSASGNMHVVENHCVAVYAEGGILYLQIDKVRWPLDEKLQLKYGHDVLTQTTRFLVSDGIKSTDIIYPSWWRGLGHNMLAVPEMDEDQDYLAYVFSVWRNESLRQQLLTAWQVGGQ